MASILSKRYAVNPENAVVIEDTLKQWCEFRFYTWTLVIDGNEATIQFSHRKPFVLYVGHGNIVTRSYMLTILDAIDRGNKQQR